MNDQPMNDASANGPEQQRPHQPSPEQRGPKQLDPERLSPQQPRPEEPGPGPHQQQAPAEVPHDGLEQIRDALTHFWDALQRPDELFIVAQSIIGANVVSIPVTDEGLDQPRVAQDLRTAAALLNIPTIGTYVFAFSAQARRYADTARPLIEADGWILVHADESGCRVVLPDTPTSVAAQNADQPCGQDPQVPEPDGPDGPDGPETSIGREAGEGTGRRPMVAVPVHELLGQIVREQRLDHLQAVRDVLLEDPEASLTAEHLAGVQEALLDTSVRVACLTWLDEASVRLWRRAASTLTAPADTAAHALLACTLHQRGNQDGALSALGAAYAALVRSSPVPGAEHDTSQDRSRDHSQDHSMALHDHLRDFVHTVTQVIGQNLDRYILATIVDQVLIDHRATYHIRHLMDSRDS